MRQLSRRNPRRSGRARQSINSDAAMLAQESDRKSLQWNGGRSRSMSGSSAILLNRQGASDVRTSVGLDSVSAGGAGDTPISGGASAFSYFPGGSQAAGHGATAGGIVNLRNAETADPYYRPPRQRRTTMDARSPHGRARASTQGSWGSADWANKRWSHHSPDLEGSPYQQKAHQHLDVARRSQLILAELVIVQTLMLKNHGNPRLTTQPEKLTSTTA